MARIRTIKPKFWDDQKIAKLSLEARLIFIAFWNFSDDNGIIIAENVWLRSKIFPNSEIKMRKFSFCVEELLLNELIYPVVFNKNYFYLLPNFQKHQIINRPNYDDVFIPCDSLNKLIADSRNNHGLITDESVPYRKGKEYIGKGGDASQPKKVFKVAVSFENSDISTIEKFEEIFLASEYKIYHTQYYFNTVKNWAEANDIKKIDWTATARNFMLKDSKDGKAVLANHDLLKNNNNGKQAGNNGKSKADYYNAMEAELEARSGESEREGNGTVDF